MPIPKNEDQVWTLAYSLAASLLTLGASLNRGTITGVGVDQIDQRATQIADNVIKRMKERNVL